MLDQENEHQQMEIEASIRRCLNELYELLQMSDVVEAEEQLGYIAEFKAFWEGVR